MKFRTVVFALAVLCAPAWAQSTALASITDDDSAKAEAWFQHAIDLHPDLFGDHDALVQAMGATASAYQNMALVEELRGNAAKSVGYFLIATQIAPNDAEAAFYYAMSLRNSDPVEYRKLAEAVAIRFPESDRGVQALYWLALDTPLLDERIALLEHYYKAPPLRAILPTLTALRELQFEAYTFRDLDKAASTNPNMYSLLLVEARNSLRKGTRGAALSAAMLLELVEKKYLPPGISHTPFYLLMAAARGGMEGYQSLVKEMANEPADALRDALEHSGEKLGKTPGQIQADVQSVLLAQAAPAQPFTLTGFNGAKVSLADYRGKVVLVNYWHPTCAACRAEDPFLQQTLRKIGAGQMAILSVNMQPAEDEYVLPYITGNGYYFTPLHSDGVPHDMPSSILIDREGRVVYQRGAVRGAADQRELELQIETLLSHPNAGPLTAGDPVPDFAFTDLAGKQHDLHEYYGAETLIDFCGTCDAAPTRGRADGTAVTVRIGDARIGDPAATRLATGLFGLRTLPARVRIDSQGFFIAALTSN